MRFFRAVPPAAAGLALITILAGCGGGVEGSAAAAASSIQAAISANPGNKDAPSGTAGATSASSEDSTPANESTETSAPPTTRTIGKTGWYDGFAITVDDVTAEPGFGNAVDVKVNFTYQNLGKENGTPPDGTLEVDGAIQEGFFDTPGIPGLGKAKGTADLSVVPDDDTAKLTGDQAIDKITLVYGDAGDNQTTIPLATADAVDSVQPKDLTATGTLAQGQINIEVVSGSLVPSYESGEKGKALLNLRIKLTCAPGCQAQGYNTGAEEFSVIGPGGVSVLADSRSDYCCDALYPETVSDSEQNILTFVVASPGTGAYTLTYQNPYLTSTGTAPGTFVFTA